jgi:hypothetical protein
MNRQTNPVGRGGLSFTQAPHKHAPNVHTSSSRQAVAALSTVRPRLVIRIEALIACVNIAPRLLAVREQPASKASIKQPTASRPYQRTDASPAYNASD